MYSAGFLSLWLGIFYLIREFIAVLVALLLFFPHSTYHTDMLDLTVSFLSLILSPVIFIHFCFSFFIVSFTYLSLDQFSLTNVLLIEIKNSIDSSPPPHFGSFQSVMLFMDLNSVLNFSSLLLFLKQSK